MGKILSSAVMLTVAFLAACSSSSDISSRTAAKLHSGSIVIVMPQKYLRLSQATSPRQAVVMEISMFLGGVAGGLISGDIMSSTTSPLNAPLFNPYDDEIKALSLRRKILSLARKAGAKVVWLQNSPRIKTYAKLPAGSNMQTLAENDNSDAVVFVRPIIYLSYSLRNLFIVLHVEAFKRNGNEVTLIGKSTIARAEFLGKANVKGKDAKLRLACLDWQHLQAARKACAQLWFARDAFFLRSALMLNMQYLDKDLSDYLNGKQDSFAKSG